MEWDLITLLPLLMFAALLVMIMIGFPVAFTIPGTALVFAIIGHHLEVFQFSDFSFIPKRIFGYVQKLTLIAVPLFIFMGVMLEKSGLANELLESMQILFQKIKGGLAIAVVLVGALLAASTGIVGATVVTMGALSLPTMLKWGYQKELTCGTIAASGTLGQIIPPSIILVLLGDMMNVDVGDMFLGAIIPGFILITLYILYIFGRVTLQPNLAGAFNNNEQQIEQIDYKKLASSFLPPILLMVIVLGSIFKGIASPTEASACGAFGALLITAFKGRLSFPILKEVSRQTVIMTSMVFTILIGAQFFGVVFRGLYGDDVIIDIINELELNKYLVLFAIMALMFILGFFLDFIEICFIVIPIVAPLLIDEMGFDKLWLAILIAINLQTSFLTPPFGFALFYLKGVAPPDIKTAHLYRGIIPFVVIQVFTLFLLALFPTCITWLPQWVFSP